MRSEYGNLRRRTRDSSWQWLLMGTMLGLGFALVMCVGGYAFGAVTFPFLEDETATPIIRVEDNETEVAFQAQLTLDAAQQIMADSTATAAQMAGDAAQPDRTTDGALAVTDEPTATPSPLPDVETGTTDQAGQPVAAPTVTVMPTQAVAVQSLPGAGTDVMGMQPVGTATEALGLPQGPGIPPELDALKTEMVTITGATYNMGTTLEESTLAFDECALYGKECDASWMQDSIPPHPVAVNSFQMEVYEVSVTQYVAFLNWMGPNSHKSSCDGQPCALTAIDDDRSDIGFDGTTYSVRNSEYRADVPMTLVTWWGAEAYCETLNRRLPTEAEWERAARGSQNQIYPWGNSFDLNRAKSSVPQADGTVSVSEYPNGTSEYGVFNLAGNASEWVSDWYSPTYYPEQYNSNGGQPVPDPQGPVAGTTKVHRGGNWDTIPLFLRSVHRLDQPPNNPTAAIGFRCVSDQVTASAPLAMPTANSAGDNTAANTAPTMAPPPTDKPQPTATPAGPTATLAPLSPG